MGERSLNPRPYKAKHNSNARVEHRRAKKKRASQRSAKEGRKEGKKERKKERAHPFDVSFARGIYKLLRRETWILCEEGGGSRKSTLDSPVAFFSNVLEKVGREDNEIKTSEIFLRLLLLLLR